MSCRADLRDSGLALPSAGGERRSDAGRLDEVQRHARGAGRRGDVEAAAARFAREVLGGPVERGDPILGEQLGEDAHPPGAAPGDVTVASEQ